MNSLQLGESSSSARPTSDYSNRSGGRVFVNKKFLNPNLNLFSSSDQSWRQSSLAHDEPSASHSTYCDPWIRTTNRPSGSQSIDDRSISPEAPPYRPITPEATPELFPELSREISDYFDNHKQTTTLYNLKMEAFQKIKEKISSALLFPRDTEFVVTGSTCNGLGSNDSDLDIVLQLPYEIMNQGQRREMHKLKNLFGYGFDETTEFFNSECIAMNSNTPVFEMCYMPRGHSKPILDIDITINNTNGPFHTNLLSQWSSADERFGKLTLLVKNYLKFAGLADSRREGFNSISIALLVAFFLVEEGVLPPFDKDRKKPKQHFVSNNHQTVGQLLAKFLKFLRDFNFSTTAISILHNTSFPRAMLCSEVNKHCVIIQDPADDISVEFAKSLARCVKSNTISRLKQQLSLLPLENLRFHHLFSSPQSHPTPTSSLSWRITPKTTLMRR